MIGTYIHHRFRLEELAGRGGMGVVYRAYDEEKKQTVAVKLLTSKGAGATQRFAREAYLLSQLAHPNIVTHIAHGEVEDKQNSLFLVMEWLQGEDLSKRLLRGPLSIEEGALVAQQ